MEFITDDVVAQAQPTDDELNAYLQGAPRQVSLPTLFTFSQVFLDPEKHGENLARDAARLLAQLNRAGGAADISALGDPFMLDHKFDALRRARSQAVRRRVRGDPGRTVAGPMAGAGRVRLTACIWCW